MIFKYISLVVTTLIFLPCCTYNKPEVIKPRILEVSKDTTVVSYKVAIKPIIEQNCYRCHTAGATDPSSPGYAYLDKFSVLRDYVTRISSSNAPFTILQARIRFLEAPGMPLNGPKLTKSDIEKIDIWIKQGALDN